jgi:NAD(P)-dependent dehydrogenase (short-subunit alcohol dehydrogenase family)
VTGVVTDVTSLESVEALRDATLEAYGAVHVLCNNAGIGSGSTGSLWEHHTNDWRWSLDVNVMGVVNGINAFVPTMLEQNVDGHVVNTTSGNGGFTPLVNSAVYATTKAAVVTITECLWGQLREQGKKVSASLLYPSTHTKGVLNTGTPAPTARTAMTDRTHRRRRAATACRPSSHGWRNWDSPSPSPRCRRSPTSASTESSMTRSGSRSLTKLNNRGFERVPTPRST